MPLAELPTATLLAQAHKVKKFIAPWYYIEFHRRFALPTSCLVLALVGIPLGLSSKKGGKSAGFVLTILLVFAYYSVTLIGVSLARQGKVPPALGAWLANIVFFLCGAFLLWRAERRPFELASFRARWNPLKGKVAEWGKQLARFNRPEDAFQRAFKRRRVFSATFPMILDDLVMWDFFLYLVLIVASFLMLLQVFTLFELLGDILRNRISPLVVGEYLVNVAPFFLYNVLHLSVLLAVLVTLGLMQRSNEITAIKATGISIYRVIVPILVVSTLLAGGLFFFDQFYLPHANKRQDALRNLIKGKPAQTYLNPDRKWIFGEHSTIYYYQFFDPDRNQFGNLSVFQFDPATFQLISRVYADQAHWEERLQRWVCTQGWERSVHGSAIVDYRTFDVATFAEISEPPSYFKKEVRQSSEMNYEELRRYIRDLQQSGFDVVRLEGSTTGKIRLPDELLHHGGTGHSVCSGGGKTGSSGWNRNRGGHRAAVHHGLALVGVHGKRKPVAAGDGCLGSRFYLWTGRRIPDSESANLELEDDLGNYLVATAEGWPPVITGEPSNPSTPRVESKLYAVMVDPPRFATYR